MIVTRPDKAAFAEKMDSSYKKIAEYIGEKGDEYIAEFRKMVEDCRAQ